MSENFKAGVREDGTVDDCFIETFYQPLEYVQPADGYLRVVSDGPGYNIETRIPHALLVNLGWAPPTHAFCDEPERVPCTYCRSLVSGWMRRCPSCGTRTLPGDAARADEGGANV